MAKIASIIVDNPSKAVDKEFDYIIPERLDNIIKKGFRVVVPFGNSNKFLEGIVINIKDETENDKKLKEVVDILDESPIFTEKMIKIALFLKERYKCTYIDAFKTLMPSIISMQEKIIINFICEKDYKCNVKILEALKKYKTLEYKKLCDIVNYKIPRSLLYDMENNGIVKIEKFMKGRVNTKKIEVYVPYDIEKCEEFIKSCPQRLKKQSEVLKIIMLNDRYMSLTEILQKCNCSSSVVKSLEKKV